MDLENNTGDASGLMSRQEALMKASDGIDFDSGQDFTPEEVTNYEPPTSNKQTDFKKSESTGVRAEDIPPPTSFTEELRERFKTLPPDVKREIVRLETARISDYKKKTTEIANSRKEIERLQEQYNEVVYSIPQPVRELLQKQNIPLNKYLHDTLTGDYNLRTNPQAGIQYLMKLHGLTPERVNQLQQTPNSQLSRADQDLKESFEALKQELHDMKVSARSQQISSEFDLINSKKDAAGNPIYPHLVEFAQFKIDDITGEQVPAYPRFHQVLAQEFHANGNNLEEAVNTAYFLTLRGNENLYNQFLESEYQKVSKAKMNTEKLKQTKRVASYKSEGSRSDFAEKPVNPSREQALKMAMSKHSED